MTIDACYQLGYVIKKHGTKGEVSIYLDVDYPSDYQKLESVFVELNEKLIPFFIESMHVRDHKATVKFEDVNTQEEAQALKAKRIYLPLNQLPTLESGFYYHEIIGYDVVDKKLGIIGTVTGISTHTMQDILSVDHGGIEVLIPIHDETVTMVDHQNNTLQVMVPEGLIDVYLNS